MRMTLDFADYLDSEITSHDLQVIARFARSHDGIRAHVARNGRVLLVDRDGGIRSVRTMRAACEWLGY